MEDQHKLEFRVGLFVLVCIVIVCAMILEFGQLGRLYQPVYRVNLVFDNVGGLVVRANVLYAGVKVGRVTAITLDPQGDRRVHVTIEIDRRIEVRRDSRFAVRTAGMLGDQHIDIEPVLGSQAPVLGGNERLKGEPPVDFGALADRLKQAIDKVDKAVLDDTTLNAIRDTVANVKAVTDKINQQILAEKPMTDYREAISSLRSAASEADQFAHNARPNLDDAVQRFKQIVEKTDAAVSRVDRVLKENEQQLKDLVQNTEVSSEKLKTILTRLESGEGTLGQLLADKQLHEDLKKLIENWRRYGLLYKERKSLPGDEGGKSLDSRQGLRK